MVSAYVGVGEVPAALRRLVSDTAFTLLFDAPKGGLAQAGVWAVEEESHRLRFLGVPGQSSETCGLRLAGWEGEHLALGRGGD